MVHVFLELWGPELNTVLQVRPVKHGIIDLVNFTIWNELY